MFNPQHQTIVQCTKPARKKSSSDLCEKSAKNLLKICASLIHLCSLCSFPIAELTVQDQLRRFHESQTFCLELSTLPTNLQNIYYFYFYTVHFAGVRRKAWLRIRVIFLDPNIFLLNKFYLLYSFSYIKFPKTNEDPGSGSKSMIF